MTRAFARWVAGAALAGLAVAGCTTNGSTGSGTGTSSATVTSSPVATASASPSSSGPSASPTGTALPLPVDLPVAAREHSPAGAEAFVRFFYAQVNRAWTRPESGLIPQLCLSTSKSCAGLERVAAQLARDGQRYSGDPLTLSRVVPLGSGSPESMAVDVQGRQEQRDVVDGQGRVVLTDSQKAAHFEVQLGWFSDGWRVSAIKGAAG